MEDKPTVKDLGEIIENPTELERIFWSRGIGNIRLEITSADEYKIGDCIQLSDTDCKIFGKLIDSENSSFVYYLIPRRIIELEEY